MDGATLQARIYAGRAKVAGVIGLSCVQYRPLTAATPFPSQLATFNAAFNAADGKYLKPNLYGKPVWFGDFDGRVTKPGDYLVRASDGATWFIAAQQQLLPIVCIECDRTVTIERPTSSSSPGLQAYGGEYPSDETTILGSAAAWPCSILQGKRFQASTPLPGTVKEAGWEFLLPISVPVTLLAADLIVDDLGRRYVIESAELTDLGWRVQAEEAHP